LSKDQPSLEALGLDGPALGKVPCPSCLRTIQYPINRAGTDAKCPGCKHAFKLPSAAPISTSNEVISGASSNSTQAMQYARSQLPKTRRINSAFWLIACFIGVPFVFVLFICSGAGPAPRTESSSPSRLTYADAIQALMDDVDSMLKSDIYGKAKCDGNHLTVTLEDDYFSLDAKTKRLALTRVHETWVKDCYGKRSTFKRWDGSIVAELEK
jgi:hypothetical protein